MKSFPEKVQVCIIGAGPAGLCAALRLLAMGYHVGMIESEKFPRQQIGESLSPGIRGIFKYLDAELLLDDDRFLRQMPSNIIWENKESSFQSPKNKNGNIVVDRSILDQELLKLAVSRGLHLLQPGKLSSTQRSELGWKLQVQTEAGKIQIQAEIVLDARGRKGSLVKDRVSISPSMVAIWAQIPANLMPEESFVEAIHEGWFWGAKVPGNRYRVMAFTDGTTIQRNNIRHLYQLAKNTKFFAGIAEELRSLPIETCSVTSYVHQNPWNEQFIKLGEAAFTLDPLSSSGVEKAMRFSLQTAIAVNTYFKNPGSLYPKDYYEEKFIESVSNHAHWTASFYREAWPYKECAPFWKNKSKVQCIQPANGSAFIERLCKELQTTNDNQENKMPVTIPIDLVLNQIRSDNISLSPLIRFKEMYAVREDCIEVMMAVCHPQLERPVGYLEQLDLKMLLAEIDGKTIEGAIESVSRNISMERAKKIIVHLWQKQLILVN